MINFLKTKLLAIILLGFYIAFLSAFFTSVTVNSKEEQSHVRFGWPIKYLEQNQEQYDPPYPWVMRAGIPQENPSDIIWLNLLIDTLFFSIILFLILVLLQYTLPGHMGWLKYLRFRNVVAIPIVLFIVFLIWGWVVDLLDPSTPIHIIN